MTITHGSHAWQTHMIVTLDGHMWQSSVTVIRDNLTRHVQFHVWQSYMLLCLFAGLLVVVIIVVTLGIGIFVVVLGVACLTRYVVYIIRRRMINIERRRMINIVRSGIPSSIDVHFVRGRKQGTDDCLQNQPHVRCHRVLSRGLRCHAELKIPLQVSSNVPT